MFKAGFQSLRLKQGSPIYIGLMEALQPRARVLARTYSFRSARSVHQPVLGQVEGGDLLRLLDLLLVRLDLALQLVDQGLHPLVVLAVLVLQDIDNELICFFFF